MKYFWILLLCGCSKVVHVEITFPKATENLMEPAPVLKPLPPDTTELSALIDNANENYLAYRKLREHYEAWQQWYKEQRDNFDSVK